MAGVAVEEPVLAAAATAVAAAVVTHTSPTRRNLSPSASESSADDTASLSTPSTNNNVPLPETGEDHDGWLDNMDAVEEAERFDEISAAGYTDVEQFRISGLGAKGYPGGRKGR